VVEVRVRRLKCSPDTVRDRRRGREMEREREREEAYYRLDIIR
jgi:hypothetical protein